MPVVYHKCGLAGIDSKLSKLSDIFNTKLKNLRDKLKALNVPVLDLLNSVDNIKKELNKILGFSSDLRLRDVEKITKTFNLDLNILNEYGVTEIGDILFLTDKTDGNVSQIRELFEDLNKDIRLTTTVLSQPLVNFKELLINPIAVTETDVSDRQILVAYTHLEKKIFTPTDPDLPKSKAQIEKSLGHPIKNSDMIFVNPTGLVSPTEKVLQNPSLPANTVIVYNRKFIDANVSINAASLKSGVPENEILISVYLFRDKELKRIPVTNSKVKLKYSEIAGKAASIVEAVDLQSNLDSVTNSIVLTELSPEISIPEIDRSKNQGTSVVKTTGNVDLTGQGDIPVTAVPSSTPNKTFHEFLFLSSFNLPKDSFSIINSANPILLQKTDIKGIISSIIAEIRKKETDKVKELIGAAVTILSTKITKITDRNILTKLTKEKGIGLTDLSLLLNDNTVTNINIEKTHTDLNRKLVELNDINFTIKGVSKEKPFSRDDLLKIFLFFKEKDEVTISDVMNTLGEFFVFSLTDKERAEAKRAGEFKRENVTGVEAKSFKTPVVKLVNGVDFNKTFMITEKFTIINNLLNRVLEKDSLQNEAGSDGKSLIKLVTRQEISSSLISTRDVSSNQTTSIPISSTLTSGNLSKVTKLINAIPSPDFSGSLSSSSNFSGTSYFSDDFFSESDDGSSLEDFSESFDEDFVVGSETGLSLVDIANPSMIPVKNVLGLLSSVDSQYLGVLKETSNVLGSMTDKVTETVSIGGVVSAGCSCRCEGLNFTNYENLAALEELLLESLKSFNLSWEDYMLAFEDFNCSFASVINPVADTLNDSGFGVIAGPIASIDLVHVNIANSYETFGNTFKSMEVDLDEIKLELEECNITTCETGEVNIDKDVEQALSGNLDISGVVDRGVALTNNTLKKQVLEPMTKSPTRKITQPQLNLPGIREIEV